MLNLWTASLEALIKEKRALAIEALTSYEKSVQIILDDVFKEGDKALKRWTKTLDSVEIDDFLIPESTLKKAYESLSPALKKALENAKASITSYHQHQKYATFQDQENGSVRAQKVTPIDKVGLYIPGGTARYPSSVLMNAIPALVAGVKSIVMVTPPHPDGIDPSVLGAAYLCGIKTVFQVGGAQAIAALAYGTETIPTVDKIVGPGNIYVALAKQRVSSIVGIDHFAGPSEVLIYADASVDPAWVAADLIAQAEHDVLAQAILITADPAVLDNVNSALESQVRLRSRRTIIEESLRKRSVALLVKSHQEAYQTINAVAPEHLQLMTTDPMQHLKFIDHAGAIFMGKYTPEAVGDYIGGPNHTLPTSGTARFASGLSTYDFLKRSSVLQMTEASFEKVADDVITLAHQEGLDGHAYSIEVRRKS